MSTRSAVRPVRQHEFAGTPGRPWRQRLTPVLLVVGAVPGALLVLPGSMRWQLFRETAVMSLAALALLVVRRDSARVGRLVALVVGTVYVSPGIGLGAGRVAQGTGGLTAVAGCLLLGAGAGLLVVGLAGLGVSRGRAARVLARTAAVMLVAVLVVPAWPAFYAVNPPPTPVREGRTPGDLGLPAVDLRLRTPAGATLAAWYLPTRTGAAVVLLHGAGSTRSSVLEQAAVLWRHGYGVLALDARGHGASSGRAMDFGWFGDDDVRGAVDSLVQQAGVDAERLGVVGLSMGGEEAIGAAAADDRIAAVVAEGATGRTAEDLGWLSDRYGWRGAVTEVWRGALTYGLTDVLTDAEPPMALRTAVRQVAPRRVLLVSAGDVPDEAAAAAYIEAGSPTSVSTWTVPGAQHTRGLATRPADWERRVIGFLDENLQPPSLRSVSSQSSTPAGRR